MGASGSLGFACCQRLGCHLENTCIYNVAWILADFQKFVNNAFCLFSCREEINAGTLKCWEEAGQAGWRGKSEARFLVFRELLIRHSRGVKKNQV